MRKFDGDVIALVAVAAGRALDESSLLITQRDGDAVDLQLDDVADRLALIQPLADAHVPFADFAVLVGVIDREHRDGMRDRLEGGQRLAADALRGAIGR